MRPKSVLTTVILSSSMVTVFAKADLTYNYEILSAGVEAGGFVLPDETLTFVEQVYDDTPEPYNHQAELITNTLTGRGLSILDVSIAPDSYDFQHIDAALLDLQAELTETGYSKVFAQGDSYFQFWVQPRDRNYEYVVRVEQEYDDGLVPAYLAGGDRAFDLFAVLEGVGNTTPGEAGFWYFVGTLAPGVDYHWYGGVRAAAESNGLLSGPFNARLRMDFTLVPETDDYLWIGPDRGLFAESSFWDPSGTPWENGRAIFNSPSGADQTVLFDDDHRTGRLVVTAPAGQNTDDQIVLDLDGWNYWILREWNDVYRASLTVGNTANATANLAIVDGHVDAKDVEIGLNGTGQLTIGEDGVFTVVAHGVSVGTQDYGSLHIVDGGWMHHGHGFVGQFAGSHGTITVDGTKPSDPNVRSYWQAGGWLGLGDQGEGSLYVANGADAETGKCDMACNPGSTGMADISGDGSQWELQSHWEVSLIVGKSGSASVTTWDGGSVVNRGEMHLAETPGSTGTIVLVGPGRDNSGATIPALECEQRLTVGYGGVGDFELWADAWAVVHGPVIVGTDPNAEESSYSQVIVDGADSLLEVSGKDGAGSYIGMEIGRQGAGNLLSITNGGQVTTGYTTTIGGGGGDATLLVDGLDSLLLSHFQFEVGRDGPGEVTVSNGGRIYVDGSNTDPEWDDGFKGLTHIGMRSTGILTVTGMDGGTPSTLESMAQISLGSNTGGNGTLNIEDGGLVVSWKHVSPTESAGIVGRGAGGTGLVTIKDGSTWQMPDGGLTVGWMGKGRIEMAGGYMFSTYGVIGRTPGSQGEVELSNPTGSDPSHWDIDGPLAIGGDLAGTVGGTGRLFIGRDCWVWTSGGTTIYTSGTLSLAEGGIDTDITLHGTIEGVGWIARPVTNVSGVVHPTYTGTGALRELTFRQGYVQQSGGTFLVDVAGDGDSSVIVTWDSAYSISLAGKLKVKILNGYIPAINSRFLIAHAEGGIINEAFDTLDLPTIDGQPVFELYAEGTSLLWLRTLRDYHAPVDYDGDGDVDQDDLDIFEACATGPGIPFADGNCAKADLDRDTDVDQTDFSTFQRCYSGENVPVNADCAN
ncbi:MAG TPA: hypothetical protein PLL20_05830 [Phycisphaerae bacterium]|nr:hypothetical protein [Phycisphaerae bacterium]HRR84153.1 hypothetical protein [Phycisphaerae bacterium]